MSNQKYNAGGEVVGLVELTGSNAQDVTFHDAVTNAGDGTIFSVTGFKTLTVEIYGTSATRLIAFIGRGLSGADRPIMGTRLSDYTTAINTAGTGEIWQFDITGLTSVFMDLQTITGGNVSVKGKAVA